MNRPEFTRQFMGDFDDERSRNIEMLARKYEDECEAYDRTVCSCRSPRGTAIPATPHEQGLISRHARQVRARIAEEAADLGIEWSEIRQAMKEMR